MYGSLYDNQEAMERCCFQVGVGALLLGSTFCGLSLIYLALQSDDEDRFFEELNLDISEVSLSYALGLQKEKIIQYHQQKGTLYGNEQSDLLHEYLADDILYERELLGEIYEFPVSTIISNNYYIVPSDQRDYLTYQGYLREYLYTREKECFNHSLNHIRLSDWGRPLLTEAGDFFPIAWDALDGPDNAFAIDQQLLASWPLVVDLAPFNGDIRLERFQHYFLGTFHYYLSSYEAVSLYKPKLEAVDYH